METTTETLSQEPPPSTASPVKTPTRLRSFSANAKSNGTPATLAPSPTFHEKLSLTSKDDHALPTTPLRSPRSRRPEPGRGLSLQMPPTLSMPSPSHFPPQPRGVQPLSPQLDQHQIYMHAVSQQASPATSLPRHSRGLDWSRACTNLHHSTLAEQSSPDSSPVITQKGMMIPGSQQYRSRKGSMSSVMMMDSPNMTAPSTSLGGGGGMWGSLGQERSTMSSSIGSVNMLASDSESLASDDDASMGGDDTEDPVFTTPQVHKLQNPHTAATPFGPAPLTPVGRGHWGSGAPFSPAQASLMKTIRRTRLQKNDKRSRKSSSSASGSGYSSMASPRATSPPPLRSIETAANGGSYFQWTAAARSRRESLALGTDGLHISSGNDSGDEASAQNSPATPGVVRRPVTRRQNLLPKTKGFARIRAALLEEAAPVDAESRREAETIRQVRERDGSLSVVDDVFQDGSGSRPQTATGQSSPSLLPAVPEAIQEDFGKDLDSEGSMGANGKIGLGMNFAVHANRNSGGMDYWHRYTAQNRTPPPPSFPRNGSSGLMSDINMDSEGSQHTPLWPRPRARSSASDASEAIGGLNSTANTGPAAGGAAGVMNDDMHLNRFKRRRDDDYDIGTIKRRAVSPGMSAQNSPVLTQSPTQKEIAGNSSTTGWGQPPERKNQGSSQTQNGSQKERESPSQPPSAGSEISQSSQIPPPLSLAGSRHGSGGSTVSMASTGGTMTPSVSNTATASGSSGTATPGQGKKLGLQGMVDTNDGLMKMSIE